MSSIPPRGGDAREAHNPFGFTPQAHTGASVPAGADPLTQRSVGASGPHIPTVPASAAAATGASNVIASPFAFSASGTTGAVGGAAVPPSRPAVMSVPTHAHTHTGSGFTPSLPGAAAALQRLAAVPAATATAVVRPVTTVAAAVGGAVTFYAVSRSQTHAHTQSSGTPGSTSIPSQTHMLGSGSASTPGGTPGGGTGSPHHVLTSPSSSMMSMRNLVLGAGASPDMRGAKGLQEFVNEYLRGHALVALEDVHGAGGVPAGAETGADEHAGGRGTATRPQRSDSAPPFHHLGFYSTSEPRTRTDFSTSAMAAEPRNLSLPGIGVLPGFSALARAVAEQQWSSLEDQLPQSSALFERVNVDASSAITHLRVEVAATARFPVAVEQLRVPHALAYCRANIATLMTRQKYSSAGKDAGLALGLLLALFHQRVAPHADGASTSHDVSTLMRILQGSIVQTMFVYLEICRLAGNWQGVLGHVARIQRWCAQRAGVPIAQTEVEQEHSDLPPPLSKNFAPVSRTMLSDTTAPVLLRCFSALECWPTASFPLQFLSCTYARAALVTANMFEQAGLVSAAEASLTQHADTLASFAAIQTDTSGSGAPVHLSGEWNPLLEAPAWVHHGMLAHRRVRIASARGAFACVPAPDIISRLHAVPEWTQACKDAAVALQSGSIDVDSVNAPLVVALAAASLDSLMAGDVQMAAGNTEAAQHAYERAVDAARARWCISAREAASNEKSTGTDSVNQLPVYSDITFALPSPTDLLCLATTSCSAAALKDGAPIAGGAALLDALVRSSPSHFCRADVLAVLTLCYESQSDAVVAARAKRILQGVAQRFGLTHLEPRAFRL